MSDHIKWAGLDKQLEKGIQALKSELSDEYQKKIEELEKTASLVEKQKEWSSFYVNDKPHMLPAFRLQACPRGKPSKEELGKLHAAFSNEFTGWSLFVRFYCANEQRENFELWVIRSITNQWYRTDDVEEAKKDINRLTREDEVAMRHFINGFERGIHSVKIKPKRGY